MLYGFWTACRESLLDVEKYKDDMAKLAELTGNNLDSVCFTGGEPLLHPRLLEMFDTARSYFPETEISFMTNGILLLKMPDVFWENCRKNSVFVSLSRYPISIDIEKIKTLALAWTVKFDYAGGKNTPVKSMWKYPLDLTGHQPLNRSFNICNQVNSCVRMKDGKIYPCNTIACIEHFNKYFGKNLKVTEDDVIEINKVKNIGEIYEFLIKPKPFCKYCNRRGVVFGIKYGLSKKEITEWT